MTASGPIAIPDPMRLLDAYAKLANGDKAELRRVESADELRTVGAFYRAVGSRPLSRGLRRMTLFVPWLVHDEGAAGIGAALAVAGVSESRVVRILRSDPPADLRELLSIARSGRLVVNWPSAARSLYYWGPVVKRRLTEEYFVSASALEREREASRL